MTLIVTPSRGTAELGDDLLVPREVDIADTFDLADAGSVIVEVSAEFDVPTSRYRAARISVTATDSPFEIASATLRGVRVQETLREGLAAVVHFELGSGESWPFPLPRVFAQEISSFGPSSTLAMEWVSRIYRLAEAVRMRPAKAVQDQLGLTVPTASVWIRRARDRGFLAGPGYDDGAL